MSSEAEPVELEGFLTALRSASRPRWTFYLHAQGGLTLRVLLGAARRLPGDGEFANLPLGSQRRVRVRGRIRPDPLLPTFLAEWIEELEPRPAAPRGGDPSTAPPPEGPGCPP